MSSICFVSFYSGNLLFPEKDGAVGGAEVQQHLLGNAFIDHGIDVSFVIADTPDNRGLEHSTFRVYRTFERTKGLRFVKYIYPQFVKTWRALSQADCDFYYVRGMRVESGIAWLFCILRQKKYVAAIASDRESSPETLPMSWWNPKRFLFLWGLKRGFAVFAQTALQRDNLKKSLGVDAEVIGNTMPVDYQEDEPISSLHRVLWVGTIVPGKKPEVFLRLAEQHTKVEFTMIGPSRHGFEAYREEIKSLASRIRNLRFIDYVGLNQIQAFYRSTDLVVLTSELEGFPNVLLHAWSSGRPVLTSYDPDGIVARYDLGFVARSEEEFDRVVAKLRSTDSAHLMHIKGRNGKSYVRQFHAPEVIVKRMRDVLGIK